MHIGAARRIVPDGSQGRRDPLAGAGLRRLDRDEAGRVIHRLAQQFTGDSRRGGSRFSGSLELGMSQACAQAPQAHGIQPPEGRQQSRCELLVGPLTRGRHAQGDELDEIAHNALSAERARERSGPCGNLARSELDLEIRDLAGVVGKDRDSSPRDFAEDVPFADDARDAVDLFEPGRCHVAHHRAVVCEGGPGRAPMDDGAGRADRRRHAARQTRERRCGAVRRVEYPGLAQQVAELAEDAGARAAEGTRPDVGIAQCDDSDTAGAQRPDKGHSARGEFLCVVDEHGTKARRSAQPPLALVSRRGADQESRGLPDELCRIAMRRPHRPQHVAVFVQERRRRHPGGSIVGRARGSQLCGRNGPFAAFRREGAQLGTELP